MTISAKMAQDIFMSMSDGLLTIDPTGRITTFNPAAEKILGLQGAEVVGTLFAESFLQHHYLEPLNDCLLAAVYDPIHPHRYEISLDQDGEQRSLTVRTNRLVSVEDGSPEGIVAIVVDTTERIKALKEKIYFGHLLIYAMVVFGIALLVNRFVYDQADVIDIYDPGFAQTYLLILLLPSVAIAILMKMRPDELGFTSKNLLRSGVEGVLVSLLIAGVAFVGLPLLFGMSLFAQTFSISRMLGYLASSFAQEFMARGVLQTIFARFFDDRLGIVPVLLSSFVFGLFHVHFGLAAVVIVFASNLVYGFFYLRHKNLLGVTILHWVTGLIAFSSGIL